MGNSKSQQMLAEHQRKIAWAMPSYCIDKYEVTAAVTQLINSSWDYIMSGESPPFKAAQQQQPSLIPVVFFYNKFYALLFDIAPEVKPLFKQGLEGQGRMLAAMIKFIINAGNVGGSSSTHQQEQRQAAEVAAAAHSLLDDTHPPLSSGQAASSKGRSAEERLLISSLQHLARVHNQIGINAGQYSLMGIVLLHAVRECVGENYWSPPLHSAWLNVFSLIMAHMMPVVVANEMPRHVRLVGPQTCPATGATIGAHPQQQQQQQQGQQQQQQAQGQGGAKMCPSGRAATAAATAAAAAATNGSAPASNRSSGTHHVRLNSHDPKVTPAAVSASGAAPAPVSAPPPASTCGPSILVAPGGARVPPVKRQGSSRRPKAPRAARDEDGDEIVFDYRSAAAIVTQPAQAAAAAAAAAAASAQAPVQQQVSFGQRSSISTQPVQSQTRRSSGARVTDTHDLHVEGANFVQPDSAGAAAEQAAS